MRAIRNTAVLILCANLLSACAYDVDEPSDGTDALDQAGALDDGTGVRNGYMLAEDAGVPFGVPRNPLYREGYDWWWHSFVGRERATGEKQSFFIEYFVINPGLGGDQPILGQLPENKARNIRPSYAMVKAGTWEEGASAEINNYYGISELSASTVAEDVTIGDNTATETHLRGAVRMTASEAARHPEYMSDAGAMSWDLAANKVLSYSVGYAGSQIFRRWNVFTMFWHVQGMKTEYSGTVEYNGRLFDVLPDESAGYQDKNWGSDFTNPWIWLNCNNFVSRSTGRKLARTSLDVGGGVPKAFNIPLGKKVLIAFYHEGTLYEYNFAKLWRRHRQKFDVKVGDREITWNIEAKDDRSKIVIQFANDKSKMLKIDYENPRGEKNHDELWNGGNAHGTVSLYRRVGSRYELVDTLDGEDGGAEYGAH